MLYYILRAKPGSNLAFPAYRHSALLHDVLGWGWWGALCPKTSQSLLFISHFDDLLTETKVWDFHMVSLESVASGPVLSAPCGNPR